MVPVIEAAPRDHPGLLVSVDTVKARVARDALAAGASIVNDVSAFRLDSRDAGRVRARRARGLS